MSFQDPDDRERRAKRAVEMRAACVRHGCSYSRIDICIRCGKSDPKPRVVATWMNDRAVYTPHGNRLVIERASPDSLGAARWVPRTEVTDKDVIALLVYGVKTVAQAMDSADSSRAGKEET